MNKFICIHRELHSLVYNLLHINLDKSCYMVFPRTKSSTNKQPLTVIDVNDNAINRNEIVIGTIVIPKVDEVKFLGVTFDQNLSRNAHIESLYKRLKCAIAIIKRIKPCLSKENFKTLYNTLFESHMLYGISIWGLIPQYFIQNFQIKLTFYILQRILCSSRLDS